MLQFGGKDVSLLDCTLRDGGYYTNWDFEEELVKEYFKAVNQLPVDVVEIGYRSKEKEFYCGAFFYLPKFVLHKVKSWTSKKLAVILNEKDVLPLDLDNLLDPCTGIIDIVRIAVAPDNISRALEVASAIRDRGFTVSFNLMYASIWSSNFPSNEEINLLNQKVDVLYVVDSYGGMYPQDVVTVFRNLIQRLTIKTGFHGHNNLEMALANTLAALEAGVDFLDSTICGMGRGAGNLKTELLLTVFHQKYNLPVNFDALNGITVPFEKLREQFRWGSNLSYMASGAFSLPQDMVLSRVKKRYFSLNSIISEVIHSTSRGLPDFPAFEDRRKLKEVTLIGGGMSPRIYREALKKFFQQNPKMGIIHSSSKNAAVFANLPNPQYHCLPGMEGKRFETVFGHIQNNERYLVLPPKSYSTGEYVPQQFLDSVFRLRSISYFPTTELSATAMGLEIAKELGAQTIFLTGYDGYEGLVAKEELELFEENQKIFLNLLSGKRCLFSLTPTEYSVPSKSIFALV